MVNSLSVFEYNGKGIEFELIGGHVFANATVMCQAFGKRPIKWLELESTKRYIDAVKAKSEKRTLVETRQGGNNAGTWIHEKLILKLAQWLDVDFELWCDEKVAELLKQGQVSLVEVNIPKSLPEALRLYADSLEKLEMANNQIEESKPKVKAFDEFISTDGLYSNSEAAKMLGIGLVRFCAMLRDWGVYDKRNIPYQKYIDEGAFKLKSKIIGKRHFVFSLITPKGVERVRKRMEFKKTSPNE